VLASRSALSRPAISGTGTPPSSDSGLARSSPVSGRVNDEAGEAMVDVDVQPGNVQAASGAKSEPPLAYEFNAEAAGRFRAEQVPTGTTRPAAGDNQTGRIPCTIGTRSGTRGPMAMKLDYVPLLRIQRDIHDLPLGMDRFREYLRTIWTPSDADGERIPMLLMNPMGKGHVAALLDALLALDADRIAARAAEDAATRLADEPGECKVALVVADDLKGGGTNRYDYEFTLRFGPADPRQRSGPPSPVGRDLPRWSKHFWLSCVLWSSEAPSGRAVREAVLTAAHRVAYVQRHGPARALRDMLAQEGQVLAMAGCIGPVLDEEDVAYTREVLAPHLDAGDMRTAVECLFGDAAGRTLGFTSRGLSPWAGLALALHDARRDPTP
jgi:hypothetical protein